MAEPPPNTRVGIAWYFEDEWQSLRESAADPEVLEPTYQEWLQVFEKGLRDLADAGVVAERVEVRVVALREWGLKHHRALDGAARSEFVAELLRSRYEGATGGGGA
jgi:hypothetical protein